MTQLPDYLALLNEAAHDAVTRDVAGPADTRHHDDRLFEPAANAEPDEPAPSWQPRKTNTN